jgi:hypothetical protein
MVSILTPVSRDNSPIGIPFNFSAREAVIERMGNVLDPVVATGCRLAGNGSRGKTIAWAIYRTRQHDCWFNLRRVPACGAGNG